MRLAAVGKFVISLDFELMWGVRDHLDVAAYGGNVLGVRAAIPRMLELFERHGIRATWATVGMVFCASEDELMASAPARRPAYANTKLSNYGYFSEAAGDEKSNPYYFGAGLIERIASCPGQEIGSHSFSHYYCLETGQTADDFDADIAAAVALAGRRGIALKSFVFPRNQYAEAYLQVLARRGFKVFRGNERSWLYRATDSAGQSTLRRACRLADAYFNISGYHVAGASAQGGLVEVPASRFLRPYSRALAGLDGLRLKRITDALDGAAASGGVFHLWWHPHNFGRHLEANIGFLGAILKRFAAHRDSHGMVSANMGDFA